MGARREAHGTLAGDVWGCKWRGCTCKSLWKTALGAYSVPWRPPPPTRPTRDSLKLRTLTREEPGLTNKYVQALESSPPAANGLAGINNHWLPLKTLELFLTTGGDSREVCDSG